MGDGTVQGTGTQFTRDLLTTADGNRYGLQTAGSMALVSGSLLNGFALIADVLL